MASTTADDVALGLSVRRVAAVLAATTITLSVASYAMHLISRALDVEAIAALDVGDEVSLATWFQTLLLTVAALVLLLGGVRARQEQKSTHGWFFLSVVMLGLSVDEAVSFHERLGSALRDLVGAGGVLYYVWVVPALVFVAIVAVVEVGWIRRLPNPTKRFVILAGVIFVAGAAGLELVAGVGDEVHGTETLTSITLSALEECAEMAGISIFVVALLHHLRDHRFSLALR